MTAYKTGSETIDWVRIRTDTILLAFSCGKDSIALWLELRKHFARIIPFYMYLVPNLEFVDRSLAYYESWFGCWIARYPHPSLYRMLNHGVFQPPENQQVILSARLPEFSYSDVYEILREKHSLANGWAASGVRSCDSPYRRIAISRYGPINHKSSQFYPIHDWNMDRVVSEIAQSGCKLPPDYRLFGRSFDGIDARFLRPLRDNYPRDYKRILEYFPLAELELKRCEYGID